MFSRPCLLFSGAPGCLLISGIVALFPNWVTSLSHISDFSSCPQILQKHPSDKMELQGSCCSEKVDPARSGMQSLFSHFLAVRTWTSS